MRKPGIIDYQHFELFIFCLIYVFMDIETIHWILKYSGVKDTPVRGIYSLFGVCPLLQLYSPGTLGLGELHLVYHFFFPPFFFVLFLGTRVPFVVPQFLLILHCR